MHVTFLFWIVLYLFTIIILLKKIKLNYISGEHQTSKWLIFEVIFSFYIISMYIGVFLFNLFLSLLVMKCKNLRVYLCCDDHLEQFFIFTVVMCDKLWLKRWRTPKYGWAYSLGAIYIALLTLQAPWFDCGVIFRLLGWHKLLYRNSVSAESL